MDLAKAFSFVFEDPDWVAKIVIGGLVGLIPIFGQLLVLGYMIAVGRNVIRGRPQPLPEWSEFGQLLADGQYASVVGCVYILPIVLVLCIVLLPLLAIGGAFNEQANLGTISALGCFTGFATLYGIVVVWLLLPAALARYADTGDLMSALQFSEVLAISRANPIVFRKACLASLAASLMAGLGLIFCIIGIWFTQFYAGCVMGHAYGQAYRVATERMA